MTDRELLEAAAKAVGIEIEWGEIFQIGTDEVDCSDLPYAKGESPDVAPSYWNPLTDDGDALRLAAHLRLRINPGKHLGDGCSVEPQDRPGIPGCVSFRDSKDMAEQMRYAITCVAAAIGRGMP